MAAAQSLSHRALASAPQLHIAAQAVKDPPPFHNQPPFPPTLFPSPPGTALGARCPPHWVVKSLPAGAPQAEHQSLDKYPPTADFSVSNTTDLPPLIQSPTRQSILWQEVDSLDAAQKYGGSIWDQEPEGGEGERPCVTVQPSTGDSKAASEDVEWPNLQVHPMPSYSPASWHPVQPMHQESAQSCMSNASLAAVLSPPWRMMLLSDGSVTRHLQLLTATKTRADCFEMRDIGHSLEGLPSGAELIQAPRVQRQVFLENGQGERLVYAASWWAASDVGTYLSDVHAPIWTNLMAAKAPLHRSISCVYLGYSPDLEREFGMRGPFWARHYTFYVEGRPLTLIYEVFSNALQKYLGPVAQPVGKI